MATAPPPKSTALENFERLIAAGKESALLRYSLGNEYLKFGDPETAAEHLFAAETEQGHPLSPVILAGSAIADFDASVAVIISRDLPLKAKTDQSGPLDHELTRAHRIGGSSYGST